MAWDLLLGQPHLKSMVSELVRSRRLGQAYIVGGPEGSGQDVLALQIAKLENCDSPVENDTVLEACGACKSCLMMARLDHPAVHLVFPSPVIENGKVEGANEKASDEALQSIREQLQAKAGDWYHPMRIPGSRQIRIGHIREIRRVLSMRSAIGRRRFVLVLDAHDMTGEAANAFLKTLEEPPQSTTIILCTHRVEILPQTILSRCQRLNLRPVSDAEMESWLADQTDLSAGDRRLVIQFSQGSLGKSREFMSEDMEQMRDRILAFLRAALKRGDYQSDLISAIQQVSELKDKRSAELALSLLTIWLRDVRVLVSGAGSESVINSDKLDVLGKFAQAFADADYENALVLTEQALAQIRSNVGVPLVLLSYGIRLRRAIVLGQ